MSVCPFCKAPVSKSSGPCPRCGRLAAEHPSVAGVQGRTLDTDFDDEPLGELTLDSASSGAAGSGRSVAAAHASSYDGGGATFDDDLFGGGEGGELELDIPAPTSGAVLVAGKGPRGLAAEEPFDPVLDLAPPPPSSRRDGVPAARPSGSHPMPGNSGTLPAARGPAPGDPASQPSSPALPAAPSSGNLPASMPEPPPSAPAAKPAPPPPDPGAVFVARYPSAPGSIVDMPGYACKVVLRQVELRRDLESLRRRRSPDVPLYEAALAAYDGRAYKIGLAITCTAVVLGTLVLFSPVIARFLVAP